MKKILIISIIVIVILVGVMTACAPMPLEKRSNYIEEDGWMALQNGDTATLVGMKGDLLDKEELVVPKTVKEIRVNAISSIKYKSRYTNSIGNSYKAKKIFLPENYYQFMTNENKEHDFPIAEKIIFISIDGTYIGGFELRFSNIGKYSYPECFSDSSIYVPKNSLETYLNRYGEYNSNTKFYAANVSYYYNYEDAPNDGYYWVDDLNLGDTIKTIPDNPSRAGYVFVGWYKERECVHEAVLSEIIKGEEEIELFAKWIKWRKKKRV